MTKAELLDMIKNSTLDEGCGDEASVEKKALYKEYYPLIEAWLGSYDEKTEFNLSSLKDFEGKNSKGITKEFDQFVKQSKPEEIKTKLDNILTDIRTFVYNNKLNHDVVKDVKRRVVEHHSKKSDVFFWIMISVFGVCFAATLTLALLDWLDVLSEADKWLGFAGIFDTAVGGVGLITERILDHRKDEAIVEADAAIEGSNGEKIGQYIKNNQTIIDKSNKNIKNKGIYMPGAIVHGDVIYNSEKLKQLNSSELANLIK